MGVVALLTQSAGGSKASAGVSKASAAGSKSYIAAQTACKSGAQPALLALQALQSRLSVGVNLDDYTTDVGNTKASVDQLTGQSKTPQCEPVVSELSDAMEQYVQAASAWNTCTQNDGTCGDDSETQPDWADASAHLLSASDKLSAPNGQMSSAGQSADIAAAPDQAAEDLAKTVASVVEGLGEANNSYAGISPREVAQADGINTTSNGNAYLSAINSHANGYALTATAASGDTFTTTSQVSGSMSQFAQDEAKLQTTTTCTGTVSSACSDGQW